jgi:hypothetical protein
MDNRIPMGFVVCNKNHKMLFKNICDFFGGQGDGMIWQYNRTINNFAVYYMGEHLLSSYGFYINICIAKDSTIIIDFTREFGYYECIEHICKCLHVYINDIGLPPLVSISPLPPIENLDDKVLNCIIPITNLHVAEFIKCINVMSGNDIVNNIKTFYKTGDINRRDIVVFLHTIVKTLPYTKKFKIIFDSIYQILYTSYEDNKNIIYEMKNLMIDRTVDIIQSIILYNENTNENTCNIEHNVLREIRKTYIDSHICRHILPDIGNYILEFLDCDWEKGFIG